MKSCKSFQALALGIVSLALLGADTPAAKRKPGEKLERAGDEIMVCGQLYHTGTPVVLWTDPGGYDAYRTEKRFGPLEKALLPPAKEPHTRWPYWFGMRKKGLSDETIERVRGGGWTIDELRDVIDQFVIHFDAAGTSKRCFEILHDIRGLSVQFMLDSDGTIYQTLDVKESAWHATIANMRSIGIEVANIGAHEPNAKGAELLTTWYQKDADGKTRLTIPGGPEKAGLRNPGLVLRPIRDELVVGETQGKTLKQYDYTPEQYEALGKLTATLCTLFPKIKCDYPKDPKTGKLLLHKIPNEEYANYQGILGHYHVQLNKVDPGPAFQWDKLIADTKALMAP